MDTKIIIESLSFLRKLLRPIKSHMERVTQLKKASKQQLESIVEIIKNYTVYSYLIPKSTINRCKIIASKDWSTKFVRNQIIVNVSVIRILVASALKFILESHLNYVLCHQDDDST